MLRSQRVTVSNWGRWRWTISTVWSRSSMTKSFGTKVFSLRWADPDFVPDRRNALRSVEAQKPRWQNRPEANPRRRTPPRSLRKSAPIPGCCLVLPDACVPRASARSRPPLARLEGRKGPLAARPRRLSTVGPRANEGRGPPRQRASRCRGGGASPRGACSTFYRKSLCKQESTAGKRAGACGGALARPLKGQTVMDAYIDVVKTAANGAPGLLEGFVARALFARRALALLGSALVLFSLTASMVLAPPASGAPDAARAGRSLATTAARSARAAPRLPR